MASALAEPNSAGLFVEGYADRLSVPAGDGIGFHVSTNLLRYSAEIARLGAERKVVWARDNLGGGLSSGPGQCLQPRLRLASRVPNHRAPGLVLGLLQPDPSR